MAVAVGKSKILIIGGTGYMGKFIVEASAKAGHPTFALVRETTILSPDKAPIIQSFRNSGVVLIQGDLNDHEGLVKAMKQVDVVISVVGAVLLSHQTKIIAAIKEAGNIKRFLPSEFGTDIDRVHTVDPAQSILFSAKLRIRRAIEAQGIPYTYVCSFFFADRVLKTLSQPETMAPPRDKVVIFGDGSPKAVFNLETDVGTYTINCVDDPRTLNKILYIRPTSNMASLNDIVSTWEKIIGKTLEKTYVPEEMLLQNILEADFSKKILLYLNYSAFVRGDHTNFEIQSSFGEEASLLYPDVKHTTVSQYLEQCV